MKKAILTLALIMSIGATQVSLASSAPKHRYHPTTQQVDRTARLRNVCNGRFRFLLHDHADCEGARYHSAGVEPLALLPPMR